MASCAHCHKWDGKQTRGLYLCSNRCREFTRAYVAELNALCQSDSSPIPREFFRNARKYREALAAETLEPLKGD